MCALLATDEDFAIPVSWATSRGGNPGPLPPGPTNTGMSLKQIKIYCVIITVRQRSCGKAIFSQACVILSTGGGGRLSLVPCSFWWGIQGVGCLGGGVGYRGDRVYLPDIITPPEPQKQAVCILLECFLVFQYKNVKLVRCLMTVGRLHRNSSKLPFS